MAMPNEPGRPPGRLVPAPRWVAPVFTVLGAATLPWTVYLAMTLPTHANTHHYRLTWVGFDTLTPLDAAVRSDAQALAVWLRRRGARSARETG